MPLLILQPGCQPCPLCRSDVDKVGFTVQDDQGVRKHLCAAHLQHLLRVVLMPLKTVGVEN